jgi:hypothetical protein
MNWISTNFNPLKRVIRPAPPARNRAFYEKKRPARFSSPSPDGHRLLIPFPRKVNPRPRHISGLASVQSMARSATLLPAEVAPDLERMFLIKLD